MNQASCQVYLLSWIHPSFSSPHSACAQFRPSSSVLRAVSII
jgi:hypothetical protein